MSEITTRLLALAEELPLPPEVLPPLAAAAETLPDLPLAALAAPDTAGAAWTQAMALLPGWEADGGMSQLAAVLAAACETRDACRRNGVSGEIFLATMGCIPRFLRETRELTGRWAFDRGFWTWRQTGCLLFRLGTLEFEYAAAGAAPAGLSPEDMVLHVHIPSDATLTREALDGSYAQARRFFAGEGAAFCKNGPPRAVLCGSWLLAPALDELLPEESGIRRFARDYRRFLVREDNTEFYRWLFRKPGPVPAEELPEDTGLQRAAKKRLAAGGRIGMARGLLRERER
jgi:hypothetical protein